MVGAGVLGGGRRDVERGTPGSRHRQRAPRKQDLRRTLLRVALVCRQWEMGYNMGCPGSKKETLKGLKACTRKEKRMDCRVACLGRRIEPRCRRRTNSVRVLVDVCNRTLYMATGTYDVQ
jgi:hypothetical protein